VPARFGAAVAVIVLVVALLASSMPSQGAGESYSFTYLVTLSGRRVILLVKPSVARELCGLSNVSVTGLKYNGSFSGAQVSGEALVLVFPERFEVRGTGLLGAAPEYSLETVLRGASLFLVRVNATITGTPSQKQISLGPGTGARLLCRGDLVIRHRLRLAGGLIPVSTYNNTASLATAIVLLARPGIVQDSLVTLAGTSNFVLSEIVLLKEDVGYTINASAAAPSTIILEAPGKDYDCCGLHYNASETAVPVLGTPDSLKQASDPRTALAEAIASYLKSGGVNATVRTNTITTGGKTFNTSLIIVNLTSIDSRLPAQTSLSEIQIEPSLMAATLGYRELVYHAGSGILLRLVTSNRSSTWISVLDTLVGDAFIKEHATVSPATGHIFGLAPSTSPESLAKALLTGPGTKLTLNVSLANITGRKPIEAAAQPKTGYMPTTLIAILVIALALAGAYRLLKQRSKT